MIVEETIHIDAAPDAVWAVTIDVERWPEWTPTVTSAARGEDGPFGVGSTARIKQPGQPEAVWTVTELVPGKRFVWKTERTGLRMTAMHELAQSADGTTNRLWIEIKGALAVLLWPVLRSAVRRALRQENAGLKARCEERAAPVERRTSAEVRTDLRDGSPDGYTNDELARLPKDQLPQRGVYCSRCRGYVPRFLDLSPADREELERLARQRPTHALRSLQSLTGCSHRFAKVWVLHVRKPASEKTLPCPYCGEPLRTDKARQCFHCGMAWHDLDRPRRLGG